jgi:hypothetical protein
VARVASDAHVLADALSLVMGPSPSRSVVARWSPVDRKAAWDWIGREVLAANDNPTKRTPPEFLARWMVANNGPKPRRLCAICKRNVLVINGKLRAHGFDSLRPNTSRCKGSGKAVS